MSELTNSLNLQVMPSSMLGADMVEQWGDRLGLQDTLLATVGADMVEQMRNTLGHLNFGTSTLGADIFEQLRESLGMRADEATEQLHAIFEDELNQLSPGSTICIFLALMLVLACLLEASRHHDAARAQLERALWMVAIVALGGVGREAWRALDRWRD